MAAFPIGNFGEMIVRTLENKKDDLIKGRFCDEEGYDDVLSYAKSKCSSIKVKRLKKQIFRL